MIYQTAPYSATLNDPTLDFKVTPLSDAEYPRNGMRYNGILTGTDTRLYSTVSFRMILSDFE